MSEERGYKLKPRNPILQAVNFVGQVEGLGDNLNSVAGQFLR
jgi:hypothetical protein